MSRKATILPEKFNFDKKAMTGMAGVIWSNQLYTASNQGGVRQIETREIENYISKLVSPAHIVFFRS
jgi:hypothetical protein